MKSIHFSWQLMLALVVAVAAWWPASIEIKRSARVYYLEKNIASGRKLIDQETRNGNYSQAVQHEEEVQRLAGELHSARRLASALGF